MTVSEIVADVLLVVGFGLCIAALSLVSLALALGVGGFVLFCAGAGLAAIESRRKQKEPRHHGTLTGHEP